MLGEAPRLIYGSNFVPARNRTKGISCRKIGKEIGKCEKTKEEKKNKMDR